MTKKLKFHPKRDNKAVKKMPNFSNLFHAQKLTLEEKVAKNVVQINCMCHCKAHVTLAILTHNLTIV